MIMFEKYKCTDMFEVMDVWRIIRCYSTNHSIICDLISRIITTTCSSPTCIWFQERRRLCCSFLSPFFFIFNKRLTSLASITEHLAYSTAASRNKISVHGVLYAGHWHNCDTSSGLSTTKSYWQGKQQWAEKLCLLTELRSILGFSGNDLPTVLYLCWWVRQ